MKFKSELERLEHPYARLIPEYLWNHNDFFGNTFPNEYLFFLKESLEVILDKKHDVMFFSQKRCALVSILIRYPDAGFDKLFSFATNTLKLDVNELFFCAAVLGQEKILDAIKNKCGSTQLKEMIKEDDYRVFSNAAGCGQLSTLKWLKEQASDELGAMIKANEYYAFELAARKGHLSTLKWLKEQASDELGAMIKADNYFAFRYAAKNGHLATLKWLKEQAPDELSAMIKARDYYAFEFAAQKGQLTTLKWLKEQAPDELGAMIKAGDYFAFRCAAENGHLDTSTWLLLHPACLAYAEMHDEEYGAKFIYPFLTRQLSELHSRAQLFRESNPNSVFDLSATEESQRCFYMIRNLIRRNERNLDDEIRFLLEIPSVKALAHQAITPNQPNELVRLVLTTGNTEAAGMLLNIDAVRVLAEEHDFYSNEQSGRLNLRQLAQDRESSMTTLSTGEQKRLQAAIKEYEPMIKTMGVVNVMDALRASLSVRYEDSPATITVDGVAVELPVDWDAFQKLKLEKHAYEQALKAYYQHKDHSALRYLSKPNQWMHPDASYVYVNEERSQRWSTFEEYQPLISMLWLAAIDETKKPTDGMTLEGRLEHFIDELALIGRAHNWDKTRKHKEGVEEEYDDLEADRPSCFSGVKRRLFQSVIGHPLIQIVTITEVKRKFRDFARTYFISQINDTNHLKLKTSLNDYYISLDEEDVKTLEAFNIPKKEQDEFIAELGRKYGAQFTEDASFLQYIRRQFELLKEDAPCHLLKFVEVTQMNDYINTYQEKQSKVSEKGLFSILKTSKEENNMESNSLKKN